jgi:hypothetical protein
MTARPAYIFLLSDSECMKATLLLARDLLNIDVGRDIFKLVKLKYRNYEKKYGRIFNGHCIFDFL